MGNIKQGVKYKMRKWKPAKISKKFDDELREIKIQRRMGVDKKYPREISSERLTDAIPRFPEWEMLKFKLKKEPRLEDLR